MPAPGGHRAAAVVVVALAGKHIAREVFVIEFEPVVDNNDPHTAAVVTRFPHALHIGILTGVGTVLPRIVDVPLIAQQRVTEVDDAPIIDPAWAGIKMAEVLVDLRASFGIGVCRKSIYAAAPGWEQDKAIELKN